MSRLFLLVALVTFSVFSSTALAQSSACTKWDGLILEQFIGAYSAPPLSTHNLKAAGFAAGDELTIAITSNQTNWNPWVSICNLSASCDNLGYGNQQPVENTWVHTFTGDRTQWNFGWDGGDRADFSITHTFTCSASTTPVEMTSLSAVANGSTISLVWETESETNNSGFEIQQRTRTGAFDTIGFTEGAGTTIDRQDYRFSIENVDYGKHVFRLKQIDFDGAYTYSDEVEVAIEVHGAAEIEGVHPNPFGPRAILRFAVSTEQAVQVTVHDVQGRLVRHVGEIQADPHQMERIEIDGADLSAGVYLVRLDGAHFSATERVVLVK